MSMSDCSECWGTPCTCGWDYKDWSVGAIQRHINMLTKVIEFKQLYPEVKFRQFGREPKDVNEKAFLDHMNTRY